MKEILELRTDAQIKAYTHPYRMKILHALREAGRPCTATEIARNFGDVPGKVHYHMKLLSEAGIVVVAKTETVNGIIARYYERVAEYCSIGPAISGDVSEPMRDEIAKMISRRFRDGMNFFLSQTAKAELSEEEKEQVRKNGVGAFLGDNTLYCTDEEWTMVRDKLNELLKEFATRRPGTKKRRVFLAGASDKDFVSNAPFDGQDDKNTQDQNTVQNNENTQDDKST